MKIVAKRREEKTFILVRRLLVAKFSLTIYPFPVGRLFFMVGTLFLAVGRLFLAVGRL